MAPVFPHNRGQWMTQTTGLASPHGRADVREVAARTSAALTFLLLIWTAVTLLNDEPLRPSWRAAGLAAALSAALAAALSHRDRRLAPWEWVRGRVDALAPIAGIAAAAIVLWVGLTYGVRAAGGADAFGYVSESFLWLKGQLQVPQPLGAEVPWPNGDGSLAPLGYRAGAARHTMVPTYSPGVPMVMALVTRLTGVCGPYLVTPWFGCVLVLATLGLAVRLTGDRLAGAIAAVFMAASPAFLFNYLVPWSDTPAAASWTAALLAVTWSSAPAAAAASPASRPAAAAGLLA